MKKIFRVLSYLWKTSICPWRSVSGIEALQSAQVFSRSYKETSSEEACLVDKAENVLWEYFQGHKQGPGIWKWEHYFDIYHRHFSRFIGRKVNVLEIGVYSGGSLQMWKKYFGEESHIYGVDIEQSVKAYEGENISVVIGDQKDRGFWRAFKQNTPKIDILIDDGGHSPEEQQITLEEMLPHLRPGGIYVCEDIHGINNRFCDFACGLVRELNQIRYIPAHGLQSGVSRFQAAIHSMHFYPYLLVIEKHQNRPVKYSAPKHGTEWQPFMG